MKRSIYITSLALACGIASNAYANIVSDDSNQSCTGSIIPSEINSLSTQDQKIKAYGIISSLGNNWEKGFYLRDIDSAIDGTSGLFVKVDKPIPKNYTRGEIVCFDAKIENPATGKLFLNFSSGISTYSDEILTPTTLIIGNHETLENALNRYEDIPVVINKESGLIVTRSFSQDPHDQKTHRYNYTLALKNYFIYPTQKFTKNSADANKLLSTIAKQKLIVEPHDPIIASQPSNTAAIEDNFKAYIGDYPDNLQGIIDYIDGQYRLIVEPDFSWKQVRWHDQNKRTLPSKLAKTKNSNLRVASFNVDDFFTNNLANPKCNQNPSCQRGAKDPAQREIQLNKLVKTIIDMDADILGLVEIENNGFHKDSAINRLVSAINQAQMDQLHDPKQAKIKSYSYITPSKDQLYQGQYLGNDATMVAFIYRPGIVNPVGGADVLPMPSQQPFVLEGSSNEITPSQRDALLQTFALKKGSKPLTVVVNHLISKDSICREDQDNTAQPIQGHCNNLRVSAAKVLGEIMTKRAQPSDPRLKRTHVPEYQLVLGDFNAYSKEDPIRVLTDYAQDKNDPIYSAEHTQLQQNSTDEQRTHVTHGYGFINMNPSNSISYSDQDALGTLDYIFANSTLKSKILKVTAWNINSLVSPELAYNSKLRDIQNIKSNEFRSSDHDPLIADLNLDAEPAQESSGGGGSMDPRWLLPLFGVVAARLARRSRKIMQS